MDRITLGYSALKKRGVIVEQAAVTAINYGGSTGSVSLSNGKKLAYDHLVLAPGIDFVPPPNDPQDWDPEITPHAWKAGLQTLMLKQQLAGCLLYTSRCV